MTMLSAIPAASSSSSRCPAPGTAPRPGAAAALSGGVPSHAGGEEGIRMGETRKMQGDK